LSDFFYNLVWTAGWPIFKITGDAVMMGQGLTARRGAYILACNHRSPFDIPLLIANSRRALDFVSITEVFAIPAVAWFYGSMNAFPLDRSKRDSPTVRIILDRLARGRVVAMFPEGRVRKEEESVLNGGGIRSGVGRLAAMADVPVVPSVIINSVGYLKWQNWLPHTKIPYGLAFGEPLFPRKDLETNEAGKELESRLVDAMRRLNHQLQRRMKPWLK
jgi:1-acyl-sn-glycerol-3-phosphate acyltransferase